MGNSYILSNYLWHSNLNISVCLIKTRIYVGFRSIHITSSAPTVYNCYKFSELPWQYLRHSFNNMCNIQLHLIPLHIYLSHFMTSCNLYFVHMCCKFQNLKLMVCNCNITSYFLSSAAWWWLFESSWNM